MVGEVQKDLHNTMKTEFEATFLNIDKHTLRLQLKDAGAEVVHEEFLMKRVVFFPPKHLEGAWMRVREEYGKITMSIKQIKGNLIHDQKEVEVKINDVQAGIEFLESQGAVKKAYQENKREKWIKDNVEICIDTWPGLSPFVEIEGDSEEQVKKISKELNFDWNDAVFGDVSIIYKKELGIPQKIINDETPLITFEEPPQKYE